MRGKWDFRHEEAKGQLRGGGSGHRRKNVLHPPTVTGTGIMNLPPPGKNDFHRGRKPKGPRAGEGKGRLPGSPPRGLGLPPGRPPLGGVSHSHRERGRGAGSWADDSSPVATPASSPQSRPLLAFPKRRRRRRRARSGSPECTARGERLLGSERRGKCRKTGARTENERACVRARGGEAGRRLVTQQNARA